MARRGLPHGGKAAAVGRPIHRYPEGVVGAVRQPRPSPQAHDAETVEYGVDRDDGELAHQGLGGEHPVERVAMRTGQASGACSIGDPL